MLTPQFRLDLAPELVVDLFAGGDGTGYIEYHCYAAKCMD